MVRRVDSTTWLRSFWLTLLVACGHGSKGHAPESLPADAGQTSCAAGECPGAGRAGNGAQGGRGSGGSGAGGTSAGKPASGGAGAARGGSDGAGTGGTSTVPADSGAGGEGATDAGTACDGCSIDGHCYEEGAVDPKHPCGVCAPSVTKVAFALARDGVGCDDENACTSEDACLAGQCVGVAQSCDDGITCNGVEICEPETGSCGPGETTCGVQICDVTNDTCVVDCSDGCLIEGVCFPVGGSNAWSPCLVCDPSRSTTSFSPTTGAACQGFDDPCFSAAACTDRGTCEQAPLPLGTSCGDHAECAGDPDAPDCACVDGYEAGAGGCADIDECQKNADDCDSSPDACVNDPGGYHCACPPGFTGDGIGAAGCGCSRADYSPLCAPWTSVSTSHQTTCAISAGALFCWGDNSEGQLGVGDTQPRYLPTRVGTATDWAAVDVGANNHACGIRAGAMYCWGQNDVGELGHGGSGLTPERVGSAGDWLQVTAGFSTTCGLRAGGALYCWGWNSHGQVGIGTTESFIKSPELVTSATGFTDVSANGSRVCAIRAGRLFCWGRAFDGGADRLLPEPVTDFDDWSKVALTVSGGCSLRSGGALYCWDYAPVPELVADRNDWKTLSFDYVHYCGVTTSGAAYCAGSNNEGGLGNGSTTNSDVPVQVAGFSTWEQVVAGEQTSFGIHDGGLYAWGSNEYGSRGTGFALGRVGSASDWSSVSTSLGYTCGIRTPGDLYCWGNVPPGTPSLGPTRVGTASDWTRISAGWSHACGLRQGTLYCFGNNADGELGDGSNTNRTDPTQVGVRTDWVDVDAGPGAQGNTCGVTSTGELGCWGGNTSGQLGDGTTSPRNTPGMLSGVGWTKVSLGPAYACALNSGRLYCWGDASSGRIGTGATSGTQKTPLRIGSSSAWTALGAGYFHGCGLIGSAPYCWGSNTFGSLGLGVTSTAARTPTALTVSSSFAEVDAGTFVSVAVTTTGALYGWGNNSFGQLANGDFTDHDAPVLAPGATGWHSVSNDGDHTCGIRAGELYCWGSNGGGALGTGEGLTPTHVENGL